MKNKPERNDPCHCGSGKKYKNCCQGKNRTSLVSRLGVTGIVIADIIALALVGITLFSGDGARDCPPGTVWSEAHQHCH